MQLNSTFNKVISGVGKHAELIGAAAGATAFGMDALYNNVWRLMSGEGHFPNIPKTVLEFFSHDAGEKTIPALIAYFGADMLPPKYGSLLKKGAKGFLIGHGIQHVLYWSTHSSPDHVPNYRDASGSGGVNSGGYSYGGA